ncbi:alpha/beta hydrolase [Nocardia macrotermitis]|uniref:Acetyl esterase n=1 Tax=Nocardia macrotermitis TaxID=2585198 RepID=A0A7K0DEF9_9NOCA|nr:alpha/beta hydrolase [Nocardia macrotermitis]MQY24180.1 Acetyl esterase [Nocardia macrotermitis]
MQNNSVSVTRDLPYAERATGTLLLDLYAPTATSAPTPVVIWLHGGAWFTGDRTLLPDPARFFVARGIAMASIEYRLSGQAVFPAQLHDVRSAIRYLRAQADTWNLRSDRIGLWGSSAGGHLAALAGLTGHLERLDGEAESGDAQVTAVAESYGPTDLTMARALLPDGRPSHEAAFLGGPPEQRQAIALAASPLHQVAAAAPPFQISHGTSDPVIAHEESERLHAALIAAGVESTLYLVEDYKHGFLNPGGRMEAGLTDVMDDGRLQREGRAAARVRRAGLRDQPTTFGFDDIGDFFVRHLSEGHTP